MLPDGGMYISDPVCEPRPTECTWVLVACREDAECTIPSWGCFLVPGQATAKMCFPKYITCSPSQPCPAGWLCIDSGRIYSNNPLEVWGQARGGPNYCWPSSLGGALAGGTRTDTSGLGLSTPDGGTGVHKDDGGAGPNLSFDAGALAPVADAAVRFGNDVPNISPTMDSGVAISDGDAAATLADATVATADTAAVASGSDAPVTGPDAGAQVTPTTGSTSSGSSSGCAVAAGGRPAHSALLVLLMVGLLCLGRVVRKK
jgi:hypothetical protein